MHKDLRACFSSPKIMQCLSFEVNRKTSKNLHNVQKFTKSVWLGHSDKKACRINGKNANA
jgi:hypothetical protein